MSTPITQYSLPDYLRLVGNQIQKAADNQDPDEVLRLLKLVRETCDAKITELQPPAAEETQPQLPEEPQDL
jgi:hypothetical protein